MRLRVPVVVVLVCLLAVGFAAAIAGCGGSGKDPSPTPAAPNPGTGKQQPAKASEQEAAASLGFPGFATKNTTRVGGADAVADAAAVALAVYPSASADSRPLAVALADVDDWHAAISAAQLMSPPLAAPVLLSQQGNLPASSAQALAQLDPRGATKAGGAQVLRIGAAAAAVDAKLKASTVTGADPAALARAIDEIHSTATGSPSSAVLVAPTDEAAFAMPAAGLAVKTGAPVLWTGKDRLPAPTAAAIRARKKPRIYVIGPPSVVSDRVVKRLRRLGTVKRIAGKEPIANAVAVARFGDGSFGWNVVDPGHGLVFASGERTADAAAAAALSGAGAFGPLLLLSSPDSLPSVVQSYLLDIQPGYDRDPVRGVYNHGWLMGDTSAISTAVQARIDSLLEIQPVNR